MRPKLFNRKVFNLTDEQRASIRREAARAMEYFPNAHLGDHSRREDLRSAFLTLRGGVPEVSVFWRDRDFDGLPMKCRIDKLTATAIFDLKSFANIMSKEVTAAAVIGETGRPEPASPQGPGALSPAQKAARRG
jgi:hypothetical protein